MLPIKYNLFVLHSSNKAMMSWWHHNYVMDEQTYNTWCLLYRLLWRWISKHHSIRGVYQANITHVTLAKQYGTIKYGGYTKWGPIYYERYTLWRAIQYGGYIKWGPIHYGGYTLWMAIHYGGYTIWGLYNMGAIKYGAIQYEGYTI